VAHNAYDLLTNAITTNAGVFFDVSMNAAGHRSDLRTKQKDSWFLIKPQFTPVRLESFGST
jgi:hypothetical protein